MGIVGVVLAGSGVASASPAPTQSTVIDRAVLCSTGLEGGLRSLSLQASSARREGAGYVWATTNVQPTGRLATVARWGLELSPFCRPSRTTVSLSARGLEGAAASRFDDEWDCEVPSRVVLRVRASFRGRASLRRGAPWRFPLLFAHRPVSEGTLAVRAPGGPLIAVARVLRRGTVQVFVSDRCFPD